tara:strand:- start:56 stop:310 length:255 start_codon:yes stop_codon:yes gene_type:complete
MSTRTKSVQKRQRKQILTYNSNNHYKTKMKTAIKKVLECKKRDEAEILYKNAVSIIDKLSQKKIIHSNTASRKKSSLSKFYNSL